MSNQLMTTISPYGDSWIFIHHIRDESLECPWDQVCSGVQDTRIDAMRAAYKYLKDPGTVWYQDKDGNWSQRL